MGLATRRLLAIPPLPAGPCRLNARHVHAVGLDPRPPFHNLSTRLPVSPDRPARTRFAPSPTGFAHLGSLRTALFNYAVAKSGSGQFVLRIEDTDQSRVHPEAERSLIEDLQWAGIRWDEGPDVGGPHGPYRQSERLSIYRPYADQLVQNQVAYRCFCSPDQLDAHARSSASPTAYPGTCRVLKVAESERRAASGQPYVLRFKSRKRHPFVDAVYGPYRKKELEEDFVIIKSDGFPTYHFASVVDDHLMEITHVIRGEEWLISTPKHLAIYDALQWSPPTFAHLGLLVRPDGAKLSKRADDVSVRTYREQGWLPSAVLNWLATHGSRVRPRQNSEEVFDLASLVAELSYEFTRGAITMNESKLAYLQAAHVGHHGATAEGLALIVNNMIQPITDEILRADGLIEQQRQQRQGGASQSAAAAPPPTEIISASGKYAMPNVWRPLSHDLAYLRILTQESPELEISHIDRLREGILRLICLGNGQFSSPTDLIIRRAPYIWRPLLAEVDADYRSWRDECRQQQQPLQSPLPPLPHNTLSLPLPVTVDAVAFYTDFLDTLRALPGGDGSPEPDLGAAVSALVGRHKLNLVAAAGPAPDSDSGRVRLEKRILRALYELCRVGMVANWKGHEFSTQQGAGVLGRRELEIRVERALGVIRAREEGIEPCLSEPAADS